MVHATRTAPFPPALRPAFRPAFRLVTRLALMAALAATGLAAQAQGDGVTPRQEFGRVISSTPITEQGRIVGYSVAYDYDGRRYTTRTESPPGATIALQAGPMGVTTYPVAPQASVQSMAAPSGPPRHWDNVVPEPGVVVGAGPGPAPAYAAPTYVAPTYVAPAYAAPTYVAPAWGYPYGYSAYPPVGISLNLGYSRGYYRGGYYGGGWHRGWR